MGFREFTPNVTARRLLSAALVALLGVGSLTVATSTVVVPSAAQAAQSPTSCPASLALVNGSFETSTPLVPNAYFQFINQANVPGWSTTASDSVIELWSNGFAGFGPVTFNAADGTQWAELNADQASTLYETLDTSAFQGKTMGWHVNHRGRTSATVGDVMNVKIGPTLATAAAQTPTGAASPAISDTNVAWGSYDGRYTIPMGQTTTVFAFAAVSTANGNLTTGNFLDNISFGTSPCLIDTKTVTDTTRSGTPQVGDTLTFSVSSVNNGGSSATNTITTDALPAGVTYVPGSLSITNAGVTTSQSDASGDDAAEYVAGSRTVTARLGSGATSSAGGSVAVGTTSTVSFNVVVNQSGPLPITNTGQTTYRDVLNNVTLTATSNTTSNNVLNVVATNNDGPFAVTVGSTLNSNVKSNDTTWYGTLGNPSLPSSTSAHRNALAVQANGTINYVAAPGFSGTDTYTYTLCDTGSPQVCASSPANVTVVATALFTDGVAASGITTPQNKPVVTTLSDLVSTNGSTLNKGGVTLAVAPTDGTIAINTASGEVTYTPTRGYSGLDTYQVRVCDTSVPVQCHTVAVPVTVQVNVVDAVSDGPVPVTVGSSVDTDVRANDITLSGTVLAKPTLDSNFSAHGNAVSINSDGTIRYTAATGFSGTDTYTYRLCDTSTPNPFCDPTPAVVTINVSAVFTDGPAATGISTLQNTARVSTLNEIVRTNGSPLNAHAVTEVRAPLNGTITIDPADGSVSYLPTTGYTGLDSYQVQVCDIASPTQCHTVTIPIRVAANVVIAAPDSATVASGSNVLVDVTANDTKTTSTPFASGPTLIAPSPTHGSVVVTGASIRYTPSARFSGADTFGYTICDTSSPTPVCSSTVVSILVTAIFSDGHAARGITTLHDAQKTSMLSDILQTNGSPLDSTSVAPVTAPKHGTITIDPQFGYVTYTPTNTYTGPDSYEVSVCDTSAGGPQCHSVTIPVTVLANVVTAVPDIAIASAGRSVATTVKGNDSVLAPTTPLALLPTIVGAPSNGTATVQPDGSVVYAPATRFSGIDSYTYQICDTSSPKAVCDTALVSVTVNNGFITQDGPGSVSAPDAPGGTGGAHAQTDQNTPIGLPFASLISTTGAAINYSSVTELASPVHGTVSINSGTGIVTYTPGTGYTGQDRSTLTTCDRAAPSQCYSVVVTMTVGGNIVTVVDDGPFSATIGTILTTNVRANDTETTSTPFANPRLVSATSTHRNAVTVDTNGTIDYMPAPGFSGTDTYSYTLCDTSTPVPFCGSRPATVTVVVNNGFITPDGPGTITAPAAPGGTGNAHGTTGQNTPDVFLLTYLLRTTGAAINARSVAVITSPTDGTLSINPTTGDVTYMPDPGYAGGDEFLVNVCDTSVPTQCYNVRVSVSVGVNVVNAVNDGPFATTVGATLPIDVLVNDTTSTGTPLANPVLASNTSAHGNDVTVTPTGSVTYLAKPGFSGTDTFSYTLCDTSVPTTFCDATPAIVTVVIDNVFTDGAATATPQATPQNTNLVLPLATVVTVTGSPLNVPTGISLNTVPGIVGATVQVGPTGAITYHPAPGYSGADSFGLHVCDQSTPVQCHDVTIDVVVGVNLVTAVDDSLLVGFNTPLEFNELRNDVSQSGQPLDPGSVTIVTQPTNGTAVVVATTTAMGAVQRGGASAMIVAAGQTRGNIIYTPNTGYLGADTFQYRVCDTSTPTPVCSTATVRLVVASSLVTLALGGLAFTGSQGPQAVLLIAGGALVIGVLLLLARRRDRSRKNSGEAEA